MIWKESGYKVDRMQYPQAEKVSRILVALLMDQVTYLNGSDNLSDSKKVESRHDLHKLQTVPKQRTVDCDVTRINFLRYESGSVSLSIKEQNDLGKKDIEKLMDIENK